MDAALCAFECVAESLRSTVLIADGRNGDVLSLYARNAHKLSDNQRAHVLALCAKTQSSDDEVDAADASKQARWLLYYGPEAVSSTRDAATRCRRR